MEKAASGQQGQNTMQYAIIGIVVILVAVAAYFAFFKPPQTAVTTITCNRPYILVGNSCCLDTNGNGICDNEEQTQTEQNTSNQAMQEESSVIDCSASRVNESLGEWRNEQYNIHLILRPDRAYEFTFRGQTNRGDYTVDFGNWMHLRYNNSDVYSFNVCWFGSKLRLQAREGGFYPDMTRIQ